MSGGEIAGGIIDEENQLWLDSLRLPLMNPVTQTDPAEFLACLCSIFFPDFVSLKRGPKSDPINYIESTLSNVGIYSHEELERIRGIGRRPRSSAAASFNHVLRLIRMYLTADEDFLEALKTAQEEDVLCTGELIRDLKDLGEEVSFYEEKIQRIGTIVKGKKGPGADAVRRAISAVFDDDKERANARISVSIEFPPGMEKFD
jgi:hypothetical protein